MAFPRSDYYGSSALGVVRLRPSRLARLRAGRAIQVPVFRSPTFVPLGGELYPGRCWEWVKGVSPIPGAEVRSHQEGLTSLPMPDRLRCLHAIARDEGDVCFLRGFGRSLRCLAIGTAVARRAVNGPHPIQLRPICLCRSTGDARSRFSAPFRPPLQQTGRHFSRRSEISKLRRQSLQHDYLPRCTAHRPTRDMANRRQEGDRGRHSPGRRCPCTACLPCSC